MDSINVDTLVNNALCFADTMFVSPLTSDWNGVTNTAKAPMTCDTVEVISSVSHYSLIQNSLSWLLFVLVVAALVLVVSRVLTPQMKTSFWREVNKWLFLGMVIVWMMGFCTYCVGTHVPLSNNPFSVVPMAVIHATEMFVGISDISAIQNDCKNNASFMFFFGLSHILAVLISLLFVFRLFGHHLSAKIQLLVVSFQAKFSSIDHLYVFWGLNEKSYFLADDVIKHIKKEKGEKEKKEKVVIVRTITDVQYNMEQRSFSKQLDVMKMDNDEFERLCKLDCLMTTSFYHLHSYDLHENEGSRILYDKFGMRSLSRLIKNSANVSFFFLSDDESVNVNSMMNIRNDIDLRKRQHTVSLYCHCSHNNAIDVDIALEKRNEKSYKYHLIDSSQKAVEILKRDVSTHPVNYMSVNTDKASVTSEFNACIVGFGETGQEALSYLYEFSALPDENGCKIPVHFTLIDDNMRQLRGKFLMEHPWFLKNPEELTFVPCKVGSMYYQSVISKRIDSFNYIVVALDNDELSLQVALSLFDYSFRHRKNGLNNLSIFIRSYMQNNYYDMNHVIESYNRSVSDANNTLRIFGATKDIFSKSVVIDDEVLQNAKLYHKAYEGGNMSMDETWNESFGDVEKLMRRKQCSKLAALTEIDTKIKQNISNYMHIGTKMALYGINSCDESKIKQLKKEFAQRAENTIVYKGIDAEEQSRLLNEAKCEHFRWMASHIMAGFVYGDKKDYQKMTHNCLVSWGQLDSDKTRSYHNKVFEVSVKICHTHKTSEMK